MSWILLLFAEQSLCLDEDNEPGGCSVDGAHYISVLLLALSGVRTEFGAGDAHGILAAIAAHARACLNQDWAATRTLARIKRSQASGRDSQSTGTTSLGPTRMSLPTFANGGLVTAAALSALVEGDLQVYIGSCRRLSRFPNGSPDYSIYPIPSPVSPLGQINYLSYFLPPGMELGECLLVPRSSERTEGRLFAVCSPTIRATACEAFVRSCFAQHLAYSEYSKLVETDILRKTQKAEAQAQALDGTGRTILAHVVATPNNLALSETSFLPIAVFAVLAVLLHESNRNTRREACASLRAAAMDLPPRQLLQALSSDEPMSCMCWSDPQGFTVPPTPRYQKQHRQALRQMDGVLGRLALRRMWECITDNGEDQCVRAELLKTWMYLFHEDANVSCVPPALSADVAPVREEDSMVAAFALDVGILDVDNPLDSYAHAQNYLFGRQRTNVGIDTSKKASSSSEQEHNGHRHKSKSKGHQQQHHNQHNFSKKKPFHQQHQRSQKPAPQPGAPSIVHAPSSQTLRLSLSTASLKEKDPAVKVEHKLSIKRKLSLVIKEQA